MPARTGHRSRRAPQTPPATTNGHSSRPSPAQPHPSSRSRADACRPLTGRVGQRVCEPAEGYTVVSQDVADAPLGFVWERRGARHAAPALVAEHARSLPHCHRLAPHGPSRRPTQPAIFPRSSGGSRGGIADRYDPTSVRSCGAHSPKRKLDPRSGRRVCRSHDPPTALSADPAATERIPHAPDAGMVAAARASLFDCSSSPQLDLGRVWISSTPADVDEHSHRFVTSLGVAHSAARPPSCCRGPCSRDWE